MTSTTDLKFALRSLIRAKGLTFTVVLTLALGIGANAAIFSVVRGVLLRPLVNRDQDRLIYIRQSAKGIGVENANFSVPELRDLQARVKTLSAFGDFSTIEFTMLGLGEPRSVRAGVVGGSYFDVMGLRPVMGRLLNAGDDGPKAEGAAVLTYRFWTTAFRRDPSVVGKTIRLSDRSATVVGVLEPSVPYPQETPDRAGTVRMEVAARDPFLVASAFCSGTETALTALGDARARQLRDAGGRRARMLGLWIEHPERVLSSLLIGNTLVNIGAGALAAGSGRRSRSAPAGTRARASPSRPRSPP